MSHVSETIEVQVSLRVADDQWTPFEQFPSFMEAIERVFQLHDRTLDWTATIAGWDLERFQAFIEARRHETGAWRGTLKAGGS